MKKIIFLIIIIFIVFQLYTNKSPALVQSVSLENNSIYNGELIVVNANNPVLETPSVLQPLQQNDFPSVFMENTYYVHASLIAPLKSLFKQATNDGVSNFMINSAYRDSASQQALYEKYGNDYALPAGYSEHETGLALDIGSTMGTMDQAEEAKWLANNAHQFGFALRYPAHKTDITGIGYEPWHFRYVGLPHSLIMHEKDFVLEEYLAFLQQKQLYTVKVNGKKYVIQFIQGSTAANVPDGKRQLISGNNMDGYIITTFIK